MSTTTLAPTTTPIDALDFSPACEHRHHTADPQHHEGTAEWLLTISCANCHEITHGLICNTWRETVSDWTRFDVHFYCPKCRLAHHDTTLSFIRI